MNIRIVRKHNAKPVPAPQKLPVRREKVLAFEAMMSLSAPGVKAFTEVKEDGALVDYRDVTIKGYLSTFEAFTKADRDGDYVIPGAFRETIPLFMGHNPVLLRDHRNSVEYLSGSFTAMREDAKGLYIEAILSNSPADCMRDTRWKVAEGHLRSLSMGGLFHYNEDGRGIFKVHLWEGSLVPIPANPDALISTRSLSQDEMDMAAKGIPFRLHPEGAQEVAESAKVWRAKLWGNSAS